MFCRNCGAEIIEQQKFCSNCGWENKSIDGNVVTENKTVNIGGGNFEPLTTMPMKWYKFLVSFGLIFGAIMNFSTGLATMNGWTYAKETGGQVTAEMMYSVYGQGLKIIDVVYGIVAMCFSVFLIITRNKLAKYKTDGPKFLYISYGALFAANLIYYISVSIVTEVNVLSSNFVVLGMWLFMLWINMTYFNKRAHLFVN